MTNSYGYNRKPLEQDLKILKTVQHHHDLVSQRGYLIVMTSLVGSQNYDLDDEQSDVDTFSLVYPRLSDLAMAKEPEAWMFEAEDGSHCEVKDIRLALNLLKKTSPNSIEYFTSKYRIYNPIFEPILQEYLDDNNKLWSMVHCNYSHMLYAMAGMAHQLTKRNMPAGKRFGHALRLDNMYYHFMNSPNARAVLDMRAGGDRDLALMAKRDSDESHQEDYNNQCEQIAAILDARKDAFIISSEQERIQQYGLALVDSFQWKLFKKYLEEVNK